VNSHKTELALGTVQFGLAYGISGQEAPVPEYAIRALLRQAAEAGIRRLDTAPAYGDIEERLAGLIGNLDFEVVSKFPAQPAFSSERAATDFVRQSFRQSHARLGILLCGMLFHRCEDLTGPYGPAIWEVAQTEAGRFGIPIGVSCYDPAAAAALGERHEIGMVQMPGNAMDQRSADHGGQLSGMEISFRSLFLQGLLLLPEEVAAKRVPAARERLNNWHDWCRQQQFTPLRAAISVAKGLPNGRYCLVGVENPDQLNEIVDIWGQAEPMAAACLATTDPNIIDPRFWKVAA
jgi:aryl-alcohol dehydrogenase-like predicted oxidoreductase